MRFRLATTGAAADPMTQGIGNGMRSLMMLPMLQAQAADEAQKSQSEAEVRAAQQRQADAHAALFQQQAAAAQEQQQRGSLGELLKSAALQQGVPLSQLDEATQYLQSGDLAGKYKLPGGQQGPTMPTPQYADPTVGQKIMQTLGLTRDALALGDKDLAHVADAAGKYQDQELVTQAAARAAAGDDMGMSRINTIRGKKEFTPYAAVGNTGVALNQVTGQGNVAEAGLRALFGDVQGANILRDKAAASSSYASAEHSRASTDKIRQEITEGRRTGGLSVVTGPNGEITIVDKVGRTAQPVIGADGRPVVKGTAGGGGKPMTEGQAKANIYGGRMLESDNVLSQMEDSGTYRPGAIKSLTEGVAGAVPIIGDALREGAGAATNWTQSPQQQQVDQARRDFINAVLRRESGAAISAPEFANADKQYFPQMGDSKEVLAQKRRNRQIATTLMLQEVPEAQRYRLGGVPKSATPATPAAAAPEGSWGAAPAAGGWSIQRVN